MSRPLAFAHIGDLHITDADQPNFADLMAILAQLETQMRAQLDFVVLPGDCADNGLPEQYELIATALRMTRLPVHIIPGDHDMEQGSLAGFYEGLPARPLPYAETVNGHRCLFLDYCSEGGGGPDFRLGDQQWDWLQAQLSQGSADAIFMHSYPADLRGPGEGERLTKLISRHGVPLVDIGHTHYNEIANDGATIYAATRSTGQREEGPLGFSLATIDGGVVSWRFKPLDDPFPFVMITSPADHRLLRGAAQRLDGASEVRAHVFGREPIARVEYQIEDGAWAPMRNDGGADWRAALPAQEGRFAEITVRAFAQSGRPGVHAIRAAGAAFAPKPRAASGDDSAAIGPWLENGINGAQLGPNRNGRKW